MANKMAQPFDLFVYKVNGRRYMKVSEEMAAKERAWGAFLRC